MRQGPDNGPPPVRPPNGVGAGDLSGQRLGEYRVLRRLGQGGMGQVYLAEQASLRRRVALKVLKPELAANAGALQRFRAEAEAVARATHANIVQVYAIGEAGGHHFMALEYVEGQSLRDRLARKGVPGLGSALNIMRQVAAALQRAGELGIIHRDIKPENILLTRRDEVKVVDFGLSRVLAAEQPSLQLTQSGVTMGTPLYMSPEQVEGKPVDARTDIYSFGVTCYHLLAGKPPYSGQNPFEVALQHVRSEPAPLGSIRPDLPGELCTIVHRMMAKNPEDRYATCRDLLGDLDQVPTDGAATWPATGMPLNLTLENLPAPTEPYTVAPASAVSPTGLPGGVGQQPKGTPLGRRRWSRSVLVPATIAGGFLLGSGLGVLYLQRSSSGTGGAVPAVGEAGDVSQAHFDVERERFLVTAFEQYANPENDPERLRLGLGHAVELGVFYFERHRLAEAEKTFQRLAATDQGVKAYRVLGRLGLGIALGLQDRPGESNAEFQAFLAESRNDRGRFGQWYVLNQSPRLRLWVARALDHNAANATAAEPFPEELEFLRKPGVPGSAGPRRGEKPAGKDGVPAPDAGEARPGIKGRPRPN